MSAACYTSHASTCTVCYGTWPTYVACELRCAGRRKRMSAGADGDASGGGGGPVSIAVHEHCRVPLDALVPAHDSAHVRLTIYLRTQSTSTSVSQLSCGACRSPWPSTRSYMPYALHSLPAPTAARAPCTSGTCGGSAAVCCAWAMVGSVHVHK